MAKVLGIGGIFFKSKDPVALAAWYQEHLGFNVDGSFGGTVFQASEVPAGGYTIWGPFKADTTYFTPSDSRYMINLMVDDLGEALKQVQSGGATLVGEPESSEFGDFGWFMDPDDNKIELWQPPQA
ncbi:MAG: VOC family protein [Pseudomonadota bacterium]